MAKLKNEVLIDEGKQFYVTYGGSNFYSATDYTDASPIGFESLKAVIEELKDNDRGIEDDDISIFILTKLKVRTKRIIEIVEDIK